jgi:hypothetical protein
MAMFPRRIAYLMGSVPILVALVALAQDSPRTPQPVVDRIDIAETPLHRNAPLSPFMQQVDAAIAAEREALDALREQLAGAGNEEEILSLLREIEQVKRGTELKILQIQADFARKAGRNEMVERIEAAIQSMQAPPPPRVQRERDPSAGNAH